TKQQQYTKNLTTPLLLLLLPQIPYSLYSPPPQPTHIGPFKPFLPQPIPILIVPLIYPFINISKPNPFKHKLTWQQIISAFF
ncbi:GRP family sugar transporter, partial [Staphylococcus epidermidis]|uniref:GRP family sugar transporter n=1 Tax=Staphylococcus epidermidis TaxID=1282 RepID=UPI001C92F6E2